jgi:catechol 2,3-dioxygenase-like lactoylglutathione lyase family enzyme
MSTPELKLTFDAVYYHVSEIEKSIAFYRDILGFRLAFRDYVAKTNPKVWTRREDSNLRPTDYENTAGTCHVMKIFYSI